VWSWGWNGYGQLGINSTKNESKPLQISSLANQKIKFIACGEYHSMSLAGKYSNILLSLSLISVFGLFWLMNVNFQIL
jgi:hypothetical protein